MDNNISHPRQYPLYLEQVQEALKKTKAREEVVAIYEKVRAHANSAKGDTHTLLSGLADKIETECIK